MELHGISTIDDDTSRRYFCFCLSINFDLSSLTIFYAPCQKASTTNDFILNKHLRRDTMFF